MTEPLEHNRTVEDISIPDDIARLNELGILEVLLKDNSTGGNIVWGTSAYEELGQGYLATDEMTLGSITGDRGELIRRRARKDKSEKSSLTRTHAEVFTPTWICKMMIDYADEAWLEDHEGDVSWKEVIKSPRLEITCGEAPYLFGRYDASDGNPIPFEERTGILDRKLRIAIENTSRRQDCMRWMIEALRSIYGYEFQGDNLLIARINAFATIEDALLSAGYKPLNEVESVEIAEIISWNLWQMDGITKCVPFGSHKEENPQMDLFGGLFQDAPSEQEVLFPERGLAKIRSWRNNNVIEFSCITRKGNDMRFDYIIGNPPYQEESRGANANDTPIYHHFFDGAYSVSDRVELISPARFLFNAGGTPKDWNQKMLSDPHNSVIFYEPESSRVFPNTSISGGVAIIYHDENKQLGPIDTFTPFQELNSIVKKVESAEEASLSELVSNRGAYKYSDLAYDEHPEEMEQTADRRIAPSAFDRMPKLFTVERPEDDFEYIRIYGVVDNKRTYRWFRRDYINLVDNLDKWKVVVSKADGAAGQLGKPIPARICGRPSVLEPGVGFAETFISIGSVDSQEEAEAISKYVRTRFARTMLGVLKVTQNNAKPTWQKIPQQDFSVNSDIDWTQSVAEIDNQLYKKYGLSKEEINFIEEHVKEMD